MKLHRWGWVTLHYKLMGCSESGVKENVIIEVAYCGSCGWSLPAKKVCDAIKKQLPNAVIDCRPENEFTGVLTVTLIENRKDRKEVFRGDKDSINSGVDKIAEETVAAYRKA